MNEKYFMYFRTEKGVIKADPVGPMSEREASFLFDVLKGNGVSYIETRDTKGVLCEDLSIDLENYNDIGEKYFMYFKTEKGGMYVGSMSEKEASFLFSILKGSGVSHIETRDTIDDILNEDLSIGPVDRGTINMYSSIGISENDNADKDCYKLVLDIPVSDKASDIFKKEAKRGIVSREFLSPSYDFEKILKEIVASNFLQSITDISGMYFVNHDGKITDALGADKELDEKYKEKIGKTDPNWKEWHEENDNIDIDCHKLVLDIPVSDKASDIFKEKAKRGIVSCEFYNPSYGFEKILKEKIISSDFLPSLTDVSGIYFVNHDGEITDALAADEKSAEKYNKKIGKIDAGWKKWHDKQMKKEKVFEKEKEEISRSNGDDAR